MYSVYLLIQTKFGKKKMVASKLNNFEEISVLNEVYGRYDLVLKIDCEDSKTMEEFMQNNINTIDDIQQAETLVVAETEDYDDESTEETD